MYDVKSSDQGNSVLLFNANIYYVCICSIGLDPPSDTSHNKLSRQNVTTKCNDKLSQQVVTSR